MRSTRSSARSRAACARRSLAATGRRPKAASRRSSRHGSCAGARELARTRHGDGAGSGGVSRHGFAGERAHARELRDGRLPGRRADSAESRAGSTSSTWSTAPGCRATSKCGNRLRPGASTNPRSQPLGSTGTSRSRSDGQSLRTARLCAASLQPEVDRNSPCVRSRASSTAARPERPRDLGRRVRRHAWRAGKLVRATAGSRRTP